MTTPNPAQPLTDKDATRKLEDLKLRRDQLQQKISLILARLETSERQLAEDRREALEQFGTDDPQALREQILALREENAVALTGFETALTQAQSLLDEIEQGARSAGPAV